ERLVDMTVVVVVLLAAGALVGVWLVIPTRAGARDDAPPRPRAKQVRSASRLPRRLAYAAAAGLTAAVITRWPVPTMGVAALGWFAPELFGSKAARDRETARTEAIAAWTEMLRDTITGAH